MKKILLLVILMSSFTFANTGWYNDYLTIAGSSYWIGSDPGSGTQLDGYNFGTVLTLVISGSDMKYWSDTQDRTGGAFYWEIKDQSNTISISGANEVIWSQSHLGGNDYQGQWSGATDILSGLTPNTTYKLHIWAKSWGSNQGDDYLSNSSNNYVATFTTDAALPVELTSFSAFTNGEDVTLNWQTTTEVNNYGFEIQKQKSEINIANSDWTKVGFVDGHGNSNSTKSYSFADNSTSSGKYSYRLKQIDIDGSFEYSQTVEIDLDIPNNFNLTQNYPNPFNPTTTISYTIPMAELGFGLSVQVKIYDMLGEEVATLVNEEQASGNYSVQFDASKLSSGIYYYTLKTEKFSETKKMLLLK